MAYEARRDVDDEELDKKAQNAKSDANNAKLVRAGLEVADKVPLDPETAAIVKGVKAVDDATGGLVSKVGGKALTLQSKVNPLAGLQQKALNKVVDSGALDAAEKAKSVYDKAHGDVKKPETPNQVKTPANSGGEQKGSLPSSGDKNNLPEKKGNEDLKNKENTPTPGSGHDNKVDDRDKVDDKDKDKDKSTDFGLFGIHGLTPVVLLLAPLLIVFMLIFLVVTVVADFADYEDAFGISQLTGGNTGGMNGTVTDPIQSAFYERIVEVRTEFQNDGKTFDPLLIVSVYHSLDLYGADISYNSMNKSKITQIANAMFEENSNVYNENVFRENLKNDVIPTYIPNASDDLKEKIVNEVFDYIERYYALIGQSSNSSNCSSVGTCTYNINGFYIQEKGNVPKNLNINDLYVRLMQCGRYSGHDLGGTWGQPIQGEELVPFEKYVLGVAYAEIGPGAPEHAFKAQMIASRSFALARPTQMGSWRTLQQEADGKWVLQVASCTADQVYCDPDRGCSTTGANGQWGEVHSGTGSGRTIKGPIDENSPLRQYAADVQGEVLVNNQGNIILTGFLAAESNQFTSLARSGYDYKQILLQVYNQGSRNYGASDIYKASCGSCTSNGEYASWKQYEGEWIGVTLGSSGKTIRQIGCLATSISIQIARSGVATNVGNFNPGTFVEYLNGQGAFSDTGSLISYASVETVAPTFKYQGYTDLSGMSRQDKLNTISNIVNQPGVYAVAEVKGNTGQHWVAIDTVNGDTITMMDPGSSATNMWAEYNWSNTSRIVYYKVG